MTSRSNPTFVINQAVGALLGETPSTTSDKQPAQFIPSQQFQGAKPGFYFSTGNKGTGYYRDARQGALSSLEDDDEAAADRGEREDAGNGKRQLDPDELLKQAEEQAHIDEIQLLDAKGLKRLVLAFEKKYKDNLEQRMKYADQPDKFLDSEVDLDEQIKSLLQVAGSPDLYPLLVELNPFPTLLSCLSHENTDIAADTIELLMELTDADAVEEFQEEAGQLVAALLDNNALELLVQRLTSLNEQVEEEATAVFNCLHIFENLVEVDTSISEQLVEKTGLLKWLLGRLRPRPFTSNKQQASEILAILTQTSEKIQRKMGETNGIDALLQCAALYKGRDPATAEEEELMQNCFDVLCSCMMVHENKVAFMKAEGVELMWLMLQNKKRSRFGALKLLDFVTTRYGAPCDKLVDLGGLKHLFGMFMGKAKIKGPKGERDVEVEVEERSVSIICNLLMNCGPKGGRRERVGAKFVEAEFEKADRLMEMYFRYEARVAEAEAKFIQQLLQEREEERGEDEEGDEDEPLEVDPDELFAARMDGGLFTLQQCCIIAGHLWALGDVGLRKRLLAVLHLKGQALANIREHLLEYYTVLGEEGTSADEANKYRAKVRDLLLAVGAEPEQLGEQPQAKAVKREEPSEAAAAKAAAAKAADADVDMDMDADMDGDRERKRQQHKAAAVAAAGEARVKREEDEEAPGVSGRQQRGGEQYGEGRGQGGRGGDRTRDDYHDERRDRDRSDRGREKDKEREKERDRDRERSDRERGSRRDHRDARDEGERDRDRRGDRDFERERERDRERLDRKDRGKERDRDGERERDRDSKRRRSRSR